MMNIIVKTNFEGFHRWKKAPSEVSFLRNYHRHLFFIECWLEVKKEDRELEFFIVKRELDKYLKRKYQNKTFESSCETIGKNIKKYLEKKYKAKVMVKVMEDDENGAFID